LVQQQRGHSQPVRYPTTTLLRSVLKKFVVSATSVSIPRRRPQRRLVRQRLLTEADFRHSSHIRDHGPDGQPSGRSRQGAGSVHGAHGYAITDLPEPYFRRPVDCISRRQGAGTGGPPAYFLAHRPKSGSDREAVHGIETALFRADDRTRRKDSVPSSLSPLLSVERRHATATGSRTSEDHPRYGAIREPGS
jgi:hypothetical protein